MNSVEPIRKKLENRRQSLSERIQSLEQDRRLAVAPTFNEQAVQREDDEVKDHFEEHLLQELSDVEAALDRIEKQSFGLCQLCNEPIDEQRLAVVPETAFCIDCADQPQA